MNKEVEGHNNLYIRKKILQMSWPVFLELIVGTLFGMIDMMMLGQIDDHIIATASIASVGITNQMVFLGLSFVQALCIGGTTMISRYLGANQKDRMGNVVKHVILMSVFFVAIPVVILAQIYTVPVMKFIGSTPEVLEVGKSYFKVIVAGFIIQSYNFAMFASLRGVQDTKPPMIINITANLINVIGNYCLIYGKFSFPELGVLGAGISTVFSQFLAAIMTTFYIVKFEKKLKINWFEKFKFSTTTMKNLVNIGVPASLEQLALRGGMFLFVRIVTSLGTVAYATHQICINILSLSFTTGQALGIASSALVGYSLGLKDKKLAKAFLKEAQKIGVVISIFVGIIFFIYGKKITYLYNSAEEVYVLGGNLLKIVAAIQPFQTVQLLTAGGLRGAGDTVFPLISTFVGILFVRVAFSYLGVHILHLGLYGAWMGLVLDQTTRFFLIHYRYRTDKWLDVKIA